MNKKKHSPWQIILCDLRSRKIKQEFFTQINALLNWEEITGVPDPYYSQGKGAAGKPAYDGLLLFKVCLLQTWLGLRYKTVAWLRLLYSVYLCKCLACIYYLGAMNKKYTHPVR